MSACFQKKRAKLQLFLDICKKMLKKFYPLWISPACTWKI